MSLNASGGIFTDDAVDMDSTLNVQGVATFQAESVHSAGMAVTGAIAMTNSSKEDFEVDMTGSAVEIANLTGFESGKIVLKVKDDNGNITSKEILAINGKYVEYATISSGDDVPMTIAVSGNSVTVNSSNGTAKGTIDLVK
jgi:ribosomal protein L11